MIQFELNLKDILTSFAAAGKIPYPSMVVDASKPTFQEYKRGSQESKWWAKVMGKWVYCPIKINGTPIPNSLIGLTGKKKIVETPLISGIGSVKEIIQQEDYQIKILAVCASDDGTYPDYVANDASNIGVTAMSELFKLNELLILDSPISDIFLQKQKNFILTGIDIPPMPGVMNTQVIEFTGISDTYFELEIK